MLSAVTSNFSSRPLMNYQKMDSGSPEIFKLKVLTIVDIELDSIELTFFSEDMAIKIKSISITKEEPIHHNSDIQKHKKEESANVHPDFYTHEDQDLAIVIHHKNDSLKLSKDAYFFIKVTIEPPKKIAEQKAAKSNESKIDYTVFINEKSRTIKEEAFQNRKGTLESIINEKMPLLDANYFYMPALSTPRLNYQFSSAIPLNVSAVNVPLDINVAANNTRVNLKSIILSLPVETPIPGFSQGVIASANQITNLKLTSNNLALKISPQVSASGDITIETEDGAPITLEQGTVFTINMTIACVNNTVGASLITIREISYDLTDNQEQQRRTILTLNKFPRGFSLSEFKADCTEIYAGKPITLSWKDTIADNLPVQLTLATQENTNKRQYDVTRMEAQTIVPQIEEGQVGIELIATLLNEYQPWLQQLYLLQAPVTIKKPVIENLTLSSSEVISDSDNKDNNFKKVAAGASVVLRWQIKGLFDYYILSFDDGRADQKISAEGNTANLSYTDTPTCSVNYHLAGYLDAFKQAQSTAKIGVKLCHPRYTPPTCILQQSNIVTAQSSLDGSQLYIATEKSIQVIDAATQKITDIMSWQYGVNSMVLSPSNLLYVANQTVPKITAINADNNTFLFTVDIDVLPQALLLSPDGLKLYVAGCGKVTIIDLSSQQASKPIIIQNSGSKSPQFQHISGMAVSSARNELYVVSTDANVIRVVNTQAKNISRDIPIFPNLNNNSSTGSVSNKIYPRGLILSVDETQLIIALAGINAVISMRIETELPTFLLKEAQCTNPEALIAAGANRSLICVTTGFKNSVIILEANDPQNNRFTLPLGLNPHTLTVSSDGSVVFVVCTNSIYSFWTQEREVLNKHAALESKSSNKNNSDKKDPIPSFPSPKNEKNPENFLDMVPITPAGMQQLDQRLAQTPFGMFFPESKGKNALTVERNSCFRFFFDPLAKSITEEQAIKMVKDALIPGYFSQPAGKLKNDGKSPDKFLLVVHKKILESEKAYKKRANKVLIGLENVLKTAGLIVGLLVLDVLHGNAVITMMIKNLDAIEELKEKLSTVTGLGWEAENTAHQAPNSSSPN